MPVNFFTEGITFNLKEKRRLKKWIKETVLQQDFSLGDINYIFSDDEYLLKINREYLKHDYYTDIITFDQSDDENIISGDIYLSVERIKDNAFQNNIEFITELRRVMIHGILHLMDYNDQSPEEKKVMRQKEEACLSLYPK